MDTTTKARVESFSKSAVNNSYFKNAGVLSNNHDEKLGNNVLNKNQTGIFGDEDDD